MKFLIKFNIMTFYYHRNVASELLDLLNRHIFSKSNKPRSIEELLFSGYDYFYAITDGDFLLSSPTTCCGKCTDLVDFERQMQEDPLSVVQEITFLQGAGDCILNGVPRNHES